LAPIAIIEAARFHRRGILNTGPLVIGGRNKKRDER